jgi:hypothetical protein
MHSATKTAVQMAAPAPEIMDILSYSYRFRRVLTTVHITGFRILCISGILKTREYDTEIGYVSAFR